MDDTKEEIMRSVNAIHDKESAVDKASESAIIESQIAAFLSKGGKIEVIPSFSRSYEEMSVIAQQQRNSLNKEQQARFRKRQRRSQAESASRQHLANRTVLPDYIK